MSRLYLKTKTDVRSGNGKTAHQRCEASVYWGSAGDSKLCAKINVIWPKESENPYVKVEIGKTITLHEVI